VLNQQTGSDLTHNLQGGTTLDLVASGLALDHDASLRGVGRASTTVNQEAGASAHGVGRRGVQLVAVVHALEGGHGAQSVGTLRQRTNRDLALAGRVVAARARLSTASTSGIDVRTIIASSVEVVSTLRVGVGATSGRVQGGQNDLLVTHGRGLGGVEVVVGEGSSQESQKSEKLVHFGVV